MEQLYLNPESKKLMIDRINAIIDASAEETVDEFLHVVGLDKRLDLDWNTFESGWFEVTVFVDGFRGHVTAYFSYADPLHPISDEDWSLKPAPDEIQSQWIAEGLDTVREAGMKLIEPKTREDGLWWADENYYPIRPIFDGELLDKPPKEGVTVVNGTTGEVIKEAKRSPRPAKLPVNRANWSRMMDMAGHRLWLAHTQKPLSFQVYVVGSSRAGHRAPRFKDVELCAFGEVLMDKTAKVSVDLHSDPETPKLRTKSIGPGLTKQQVDGWKRELFDYLAPQPDPSGLWWGDENFYPVRPVYEGEDTEHKPEPSCTLVNGASGEVVREMRFYTLKQLREVLSTALDEAKWVNADDLEEGTQVAGWQLHKGMKLCAEYNTSNAGTDVIEVLGIGDDSQIKWDSIQQAMKETKTKTMKALDDAVSAGTHGQGVHVFVKMLGSGGTGGKWGRGNSDPRRDIVIWEPEDKRYGESGPYYYIFQGRLCRGSGAERLTFYTLDVKVLRQMMDTDEYRTPDKRLLRRFKVMNPSGDVLDFAWWLSHMDTFKGYEMPKIVRHYVDQQTGYGAAMPIENIHDAETCAVSLKNLEGDDERNMLMHSTVPGGFKLEDLGVDVVSAAKAWFAK